MNELIIKIEDVVNKVLAYDQKDYPAAAEDLISSLISGFTKIVTVYANPEMSEYAEDATYWPGQLERILSAFDTGDDFALVDILYNETRANLLELGNIMREKGLSDGFSL